MSLEGSMIKIASASGLSATIFLCHLRRLTISIVLCLRWNLVVKSREYSQPSSAARTILCCRVNSVSTTIFPFMCILNFSFPTLLKVSQESKISHMSSLLSEVRVPLSGSDPSPPSAQVVCFLHRYEPSYALIQTILVTLLVYCPVQVNCPDIGPFPAGWTHDVLFALGFLACYIRPEELAGRPITARYS